MAIYKKREGQVLVSEQYCKTLDDVLYYLAQNPGTEFHTDRDPDHRLAFVPDGTKVSYGKFQWTNSTGVKNLRVMADHLCFPITLRKMQNSEPVPVTAVLEDVWAGIVYGMPVWVIATNSEERVEEFLFEESIKLTVVGPVIKATREELEGRGFVNAHNYFIPMQRSPVLDNYYRKTCG